MPEVELINGEESTYRMAPKDVIVTPDGTVFWSRPGEIKAFCTLQARGQRPPPLRPVRGFGHCPSVPCAASVVAPRW